MLAIFFLLPFYIIISIAIKIDDPKGPVLFRQKRIGKNKTHFDILKYRTMKVDAPRDVATEDLHDPQGLLVDGFHRTEERCLLIERLTVI